MHSRVPARSGIVPSSIVRSCLYRDCPCPASEATPARGGGPCRQKKRRKQRSRSHTRGSSPREPRRYRKIEIHTQKREGTASLPRRQVRTLVSLLRRLDLLRQFGDSLEQVCVVRGARAGQNGELRHGRERRDRTYRQRVRRRPPGRSARPRPEARHRNESARVAALTPKVPNDRPVKSRRRRQRPTLLIATIVFESFIPAKC